VSAALVIGALLAVGSVVLVAAPFLREPAPADDRLLPPDATQQRRLALAEERDRALAALKELEFDHRTGKVSDEDYRELVVVLRQRAAETLRARGYLGGAQAVYRADDGATETARARLAHLDEHARQREAEMQSVTAHAQDIDRKSPEARPSEMVEIPEEPAAPGEQDPVGPAVIPEPYPPPDEGNPPEPAIIPEPSPAVIPEPGPLGPAEQRT
jgi:hypothetical protein